MAPRLKGKTLKQARKALRKAHCSLGKVKRPKHHQQHKLRVRKQSVRPGSVHANHYRVAVTIR